jgi:hypothetical protein
MRIGVPDDGNAPTHTTQRVAFDQLAAGFGPGFNGPILVVVELPTSGGLVIVQRVHDALQADPGVAAVTAPVLNPAGDTAVLTANPTTAPQDERTDQLVRHLRADVLPATVVGTEARVSLTGQAMVTDLTDRISSRLPIFIAAVVAMSFLLLMIVFRSILVPLKAAVMNLLSIVAAYGVLVAVFQWGWGAELIGLHSTMPINPFLPLIMFAILFGLSMDYEVFLLSRIREEYVATGDNHEAVVRGLSGTARVITSAALIMISVFGAFVLSDDPNGKLFGVGLAVAVLIDATLVRMVLVPATMSQLVAPRLARPDPPAPRPRRCAQRAGDRRRARARAHRRLIEQRRGAVAVATRRSRPCACQRSRVAGDRIARCSSALTFATGWRTEPSRCRTACGRGRRSRSVGSTGADPWRSRSTTSSCSRSRRSPTRTLPGPGRTTSRPFVAALHTRVRSAKTPCSTGSSSTSRAS